MYLSELHGKLSSRLRGSEDILTSNVFSFFKYSDRSVYLKAFLEDLGFKFTHDELAMCQFIFWPSYDDLTEPDLILIIGDYYLLFEMKYFSDFAPDQIEREILGGIAEAELLKKKFSYIALTNDYYLMEDKFKKHRKLLGNEFKWTNWQHICYLIERIVTNRPEELMAQDLCQLLLKKNLRQFEGYSNLGSLKTIKAAKKLYFDLLSTRYAGYHSKKLEKLFRGKFNADTKKAIKTLRSEGYIAPVGKRPVNYQPLKWLAFVARAGSLHIEQTPPVSHDSFLRQLSPESLSRSFGIGEIRSSVGLTLLSSKADSAYPHQASFFI